MPKMIQLRHIPDSLQWQLKTWTVLAGVSLSDYLIREVSKIAEHTALDQIIVRLAALKSAQLKTAPTTAVREEGDRL